MTEKTQAELTQAQRADGLAAVRALMAENGLTAADFAAARKPGRPLIADAALTPAERNTRRRTKDLEQGRKNLTLLAHIDDHDALRVLAKELAEKREKKKN